MAVDVGDVTPEDVVARSAYLSHDGRYRYVLRRVWDDEKPTITWVMLNPSTANADTDDHTIRKCMAYARRWGAGSIHVVNLYALRATDPRELWTADDPVGGWANELALVAALNECDPVRGDRVIVAWGTNARPDRVGRFADVARDAGVTLHALRITRSGAPGHPARLPMDLPLLLWAPLAS